MPQAQPVKNSLIENPVIITGLTRSGKWMLSTIVSSFKRAEHVSVDFLMEQIVMMRVLGLMTEDAVKCLLRYAVDLNGYNMSIGRNVNVRPGDYTSIWGSGKAGLFLKRLFSKEGDKVLKNIRENDPLFVFLVHDALWHFDIYNDAFPKMKMVHIDRHPVDLAYSWYSKGYGADFANNYFSGTVMVKAEDKQFFYYTAGKEKEYSKMSEADRVIHMIKDLVDRHYQKYDSLADDEKKKIKMVCFENFVTDPDAILRNLALFLGTDESKDTLRVLREQRCPRKLSPADREKKARKIEENCSRDSFQVLMDMASEYELKNGLK